VLYCVSRLEEIANLIGELGPAGQEVGVFTADEEYNDLGIKEPFEARILITTQQMIDSRLQHGASFGDLTEFHYYGTPRQVRIWDEAMMPAEELTLNVVTLAAMADALRKLGPKFSEKILDVCEEVRKLKNGATYRFFDPKEYGVEYDRARTILKKQPTKLRETGRTIWQLAGKEVRVKHDPSGNTMLDYRNHLPEDFFPVVILDASGRVRATYELWEKHRKNLVHLTRAQKSYSNLTIHVWNRGGGKEAWRMNSSNLLDGIVATINERPDEKWLVVVHKEDDWEDRGQRRIPDLEAMIRELVKNPNNLSFLTWGNAHATNDFRMCTNVILAGTLFYPPSVYEVRARAAMGLEAVEALEEENYRQLELGEHKHLILQAACRGSIRRCKGAEGEPMNLYVIARKETGIPGALPDIFPGAGRLLEWQPVDKPLRGYAERLVQYVNNNLGKAPDSMLKFADVENDIGMKYKPAFNRVRNRPDVLEAFKQGRITTASINGSSRLTHFRRVA
jgi:hypothetical protein